MKKSLLLVVCALMFASFGFAEVSLSVSGGYTTFKMDQVNNDLTTRFNIAGYLPPWSSTKTLISGGYTIGGQLSYVTGAGLSFDLRAEYMVPNDGVLKYENTLINQTITQTYMTNFVPLLGGLSFNAYLPGTPISIGASVAAGYGFANYLHILKYVINDSVWSNDELRGSGGCFTYQGTGNIGYQLSKSMDLMINIGYRSALVADLKADKTSGVFGSVQGEPIKDYNGDVMAFDFTGLIFQLTLSNKF